MAFSVQKEQTQMQGGWKRLWMLSRDKGGGIDMDVDGFESEIIKKIQVLKSSKEDKSSQIDALEWVREMIDFYKDEEVE